MPCRAGCSGPVRPVVDAKIHGAGARRLQGAEPDLHRRCRCSARAHRLHPMAQPAGWHRGRPHADPHHPRPLPGGDVGSVPNSRPHLPAGAHPAGCFLHRDRLHLGPADAGPDGAEFTRLVGGGQRRRPQQRRIPIRHLAGDRDRLRRGPCQPHHLCGRAGLGALHSGRIRAACVRPPDAGRARTWPETGRLSRAQRLSH